VESEEIERIMLRPCREEGASDVVRKNITPPVRRGDGSAA